MCSLEQLNIDLKGLDEGLTTLRFGLGDAFFESLDQDEIGRGSIVVSLDIMRSGDCFELRFHTEGTVTLPCDMCLDDMEQPILTDDMVVVRFGDDYTEDDELLTVPERDGTLDVSWLIYESVLLNIPAKHVHAPGKCNPAMIKTLEEYSTTRSSGEDEERGPDPRWKELEKLKTIIKD